MTTRSNSDFSIAMRRDERRLKLRSRILFQRPNNVCVKLVIRFLKHDHVTIAPIFKKGDVVQTVAQEQMRTKTFKTYSYHRDVSWRIVVTRHFRTLGHSAPAEQQGTEREWKPTSKKKIMVGWKIEKECRKKKAAKCLFMTNVTGLLLARFLVIFT